MRTYQLQCIESESGNQDPNPDSKILRFGAFQEQYQYNILWNTKSLSDVQLI